MKSITTVIPNNVVEKAIEGGWRDDTIRYQAIRAVTGTHMVPVEVIALDPTFWQALGKSLGWGSWYDEEGMPRHHLPALAGWYPSTKTASGFDEQSWEGVALYFVTSFKARAPRSFGRNC